MLPTHISIPGVNKNTARAIISALLASRGITRGDLATKCGVSRMTVGKVVSAMCDAGYAEIGEEISARGRVAEFIYPSECFTFLVFDIGEHSMSADIYDARENTIFSYTQPRNQSVDITTDVTSFVALVKEQLDNTENHSAYRLSALLYHKDSGLDVCPLAKQDLTLIIERSIAAADYAHSMYPNECIAFVGAKDGADICIISDGKLIRGRAKSQQSAKHITSEFMMLDTLTSKLTFLFEFVIPDRIVVDSRSLHLSHRFSDELGERILARNSMQKEELPELVTNDGIPFPSRAVIGQLIDRYAELISAN